MNASERPLDAARARRRDRTKLLAGLAIAALVLIALGLAAGSDGLSWRTWQADLASDRAGLIVGGIRAPRTLGTLLVGALLGLSGAIAQGLFRNPLADPYLLGSAAGASLAVVLVLSAGAVTGPVVAGSVVLFVAARVGLVAAAFVGALVGVGLTLMLARGARQSVRLLLAGIVVGVLLGAASDLLTVVAPEALHGRQAFLLGTTGFLGWSSVTTLGVGLAVALPIALRLGRVLDALTLGEDASISLGLAAHWRTALVAAFALATGLAVSQAGLVAFVGLVAPHVVRRLGPGPHGYLLLASAATGGVLLLAADVVARVVIAPREVPVGIVTAIVGGVYLLWLLRRRDA